MLEKVEKASSALTPRKDLYEIFSHSDYSLKKKKKIIDALDDIDGFELSFLISFILNLDITGHLNIISKSNEVIGVSFSHGFITHIDLPDRQTYFGKLMVDQGYVTTKDLEEALKNTEVHIGQYFLKQKKVTQQQIDITFRKQMELRLTKLISDNTYNINFADAAETQIFIKITRRDYYEMCYQWLESRFAENWLEDHFKTWSNYLVIFMEGPTYIPDAFKKPLFVDLPGFDKEVRKNLPFKDLQNLYNDKKPSFLKAMYLLSLIGAIIFKESPKTVTKSKLETIYLQLKDKKDRELSQALAVLTRIPEHQSEPIYLTFSKIISEHDDDNSQDFKSNLVKIGIEYLSYVNNNPHLANTPTSGAGSGAKIGLGTGLATGLGKSTAPHQQTEATIAQSAINIIQNDLLMGKYFQAFGQLKKAFLGNVITPSMHVYLLWAKIGHALAANLKVNLPKYENEIEKLSAEDKATAEYEYISAMLAKLKNDKANSERHYQAAVQKNPVYLKFPINKNFLTKILSTIGIKR